MQKAYPHAGHIFNLEDTTASLKSQRGGFIQRKDEVDTQAAKVNFRI